MPTNQTNHVLEHLRRTVLQDPAGPSDGQLLGRFLEHQDEAAFAFLVRRHGPMVWDVCLRVLGKYQDAEDAFQATFLVLVRKAASVVPREMVGNWLYGVAHQTALQARRGIVRRKAREKQVAMPPEPTRADPDPWQDLRPLLDQELSRLPDKYRVAVILCDLEGKTRKEAAHRLGWPEGTVAGRLARARAMLAQRLARRGVVPTDGALAGLASSCVPGAVVSATLQAVTVRASGTISAPVAILTQGVLNAMLLTKLKTVVALLVMLGVVTLTCGMLTGKGDAPDSLASEGKKESARVSLDQKDKAVREELRLLQGTWRCVGLDLGGERVEGKRYTERYGPNPILISGNKLSVAIGKKRIDCTFVIDPTRTPKWIDSKREPDGLALFGIYEFEDGRLKLYDSGGKRPTEFRTKKGTTEVFHIYERDTRADALSRERKKFVGTWRVISSEVNGKELREGDFEGIVVCDAEGRWKQQTGDGTTLAEGTSEIDLTANPRAIHFTVTSKGADKGKTIRKVYEFTGEDALRWSPYPSEKDRPTVFPPKPGPQRSLDVLERVKKQPATSHPKIPPKEAPARAPTPGSYTGAGLVMMIDANGVVSYPNTPGPVICHLELTADGGLKAEFPDKKLGRGKWDPVTLKLSSKEKWVVWTTVVKGDTYKVTAMPYSPEAYLFELEIRSDGKLVAGALQFYAICEPRPREK